WSTSPHVHPSVSPSRHLERALRVFAQHYNTHRPHRSLKFVPPELSEQKAHAVRPSPTPRSSGAIDRAASSTNTTSPHEPSLRTLHESGDVAVFDHDTCSAVEDDAHVAVPVARTGDG